MRKRMIEELLGAAAGEAVTVSPDLVLITNGFSHGVTEFASKVAEPEKVLVMYDHNVPSGSPEDAKVFGEILRFAKRYGTRFLQAKGTALQYLYDEEIKPGQIVVTGSRHSSVFGAKGALGIGISNTELARVLENGKYHVIVPETLGIAVTGKIPEGVGIVDAALGFLEQHPALSGKAVEFIGGSLTEHEKAVLCHMACDTGAYTAFWAEDGKTEEMLDLSKAVSMVRKPCTEAADQMKAEFAALSVLDGEMIHAGQIGGCNGGTIVDMRKAAACMEGKTLKLGFRLTVCPATSKDYLKALEEGLITRFIDYGAQISAAGDHSVVPQGAGAMGPKETLITTGLYTFAGCMGCSDAKVYTASVETIIRASFADC
ncbi:MAG: aconitase family protein [Lachnospiraceae bacterium]|nr:aconitase family protein [Lachnospiraceae bacterium]